MRVEQLSILACLVLSLHFYQPVFTLSNDPPKNEGDDSKHKSTAGGNRSSAAKVSGKKTSSASKNKSKSSSVKKSKVAAANTDETSKLSKQKSSSKKTSTSVKKKSGVKRSSNGAKNENDSTEKKNEIPAELVPKLLDLPTFFCMKDYYYYIVQIQEKYIMQLQEPYEESEVEPMTLKNIKSEVMDEALRPIQFASPRLPLSDLFGVIASKDFIRKLIVAFVGLTKYNKDNQTYMKATRRLVGGAIPGMGRISTPAFTSSDEGMKESDFESWTAAITKSMYLESLTRIPVIYADNLITTASLQLGIPGQVTDSLEYFQMQNTGLRRVSSAIRNLTYGALSLWSGNFFSILFRYTFMGEAHPVFKNIIGSKPLFSVIGRMNSPKKCLTVSRSVTNYQNSIPFWAFALLSEFARATSKQDALFNTDFMPQMMLKHLMSAGYTDLGMLCNLEEKVINKSEDVEAEMGDVLRGVVEPMKENLRLYLRSTMPEGISTDDMSTLVLTPLKSDEKKQTKSQDLKMKQFNKDIMRMFNNSTSDGKTFTNTDPKIFKFICLVVEEIKGVFYQRYTPMSIRVAKDKSFPKKFGKELSSDVLINEIKDNDLENWSKEFASSFSSTYDDMRGKEIISTTTEFQLLTLLNVIRQRGINASRRNETTYNQGFLAKFKDFFAKCYDWYQSPESGPYDMLPKQLMESKIEN